jgi:hypothetical protein
MSSRSHFAAPLLLAIIVALILYVSLYPFRLMPTGRSRVAPALLGPCVARRHAQ